MREVAEVAFHRQADAVPEPLPLPLQVRDAVHLPAEEPGWIGAIRTGLDLRERVWRRRFFQADEERACLEGHEQA